MNSVENIELFFVELLKNWKNNTNDSEILEKFKLLNIEEIKNLIFFLLKNSDKKSVKNKLLKISENLNIVFDQKLIYIAIKSVFLYF